MPCVTRQVVCVNQPAARQPHITAPRGCGESAIGSWRGRDRDRASEVENTQLSERSRRARFSFRAKGICRDLGLTEKKPI